MDLPEGWVPLSQFDSKDRGRTDGHSPEYKVLAAAVRAGDVPGLQDAKSRRFYVPKDAAERFLMKRAVPQRIEPQQADWQYDAACKSLASIDTTLDEIYLVMERLAAAVESMATQRNDLEQRLRREIDAACQNANGFQN